MSDNNRQLGRLTCRCTMWDESKRIETLLNKVEGQIDADKLKTDKDLRKALSSLQSSIVRMTKLVKEHDAIEQGRRAKLMRHMKRRRINVDPHEYKLKTVPWTIGKEATRERDEERKKQNQKNKKQRKK